MSRVDACRLFCSYFGCLVLTLIFEPRTVVTATVVNGAPQDPASWRPLICSSRMVGELRTAAGNLNCDVFARFITMANAGGDDPVEQNQDFFGSSNCSCQRLIDILDDVVTVLDPDGQPNHFRANSPGDLLFFIELRVSCRCRMNSQTLGISHIGQM